MKGKAHSDETKAAVMAVLLAGQGVNEVAKQYDLTPSTVRNWKNQISGEKLVEVSAKKTDEFGELLFTYLRETLKTLAAQSQHFRDLTWLNKQSASSLAILHGVSADKAIRLLEALQGGDDGDGAP